MKTLTIHQAFWLNPALAAYAALRALFGLPSDTADHVTEFLWRRGFRIDKGRP